MQDWIFLDVLSEMNVDQGSVLSDAGHGAERCVYRG